MVVIEGLPKYAQEFWRNAFEFVKRNENDWALIVAKTEQFESWRRYFEHKGWKPFAIKQIEQGKILSIVMPAEWPEWFDSEYFDENRA